MSRSPTVILTCVALLIGTTLAAGCGPKTIQPAGTSDESRQLVSEMLDAWKSGKKPDEFQNTHTPKVIVGDEDWSAGAQLKSFEISPPVEYGGNWRVPAVVTVVTEKQGERQRKVAYGVTLKPAITIIRADDTEF